MVDWREVVEGSLRRVATRRGVMMWYGLEMVGLLIFGGVTTTEAHYCTQLERGWLVKSE